MSVASKTGLKIGTKAPDFKDLPGVDGKKHSLSDYSSAPVLVVVFSCNHCPYAQAYENRLIDLQKEFGPRGLQVIAINSNDADQYPEDGFENMVERAQEKGFNFPYLRDESQHVAKAYQATHTPHLFVFDRDRHLKYTGRIDDNWQNPSLVKERYLHNAILALLEGNEPKPQETFAIGCTIKWKL